jgi:hypothetical protein
MPAAHCAEAADHIPDGLSVVPIKTLADAVAAVQAWNAGETSLPSCPREA